MTVDALPGAVLVVLVVLVLAVLAGPGRRGRAGPPGRPQDVLLAAARGVVVLASLVERTSSRR